MEKWVVLYWQINEDGVRELIKTEPYSSYKEAKIFAKTVDDALIIADYVERFDYANQRFA